MKVKSKFCQPYDGNDNAIALLAGNTELYLVLSDLGYDLSFIPAGVTRVICRQTRQPKEFACALNCWRWLKRTKQLDAFAEKRHRDKGKAAASANGNGEHQGELDLR